MLRVFRVQHLKKLLLFIDFLKTFADFNHFCFIFVIS